MQSPIDITSLLKAALAEDIGAGDITSLATIPADATARFAMNARAEMVLAGLVFLPELFALVDDYLGCHPGFMPGSPEARDRALKEIPSYDGRTVSVTLHVNDGDRVSAGTTLATLSGPARALLSGERVALNLVQQLSGVATLTRQYVDAVAGTGATILDTRKTWLGMRTAQKYAVKCGGGQNHRMGLYDAVLIKDNHIAVAGGVAAAVKAARGYDASKSIEVECDTLAQLDEALAAGVDSVLLDNMSNDQLRAAVAKVRAHNAALSSLPPRGRAGVGPFEAPSETNNGPLLTSPLGGEGLVRGVVKTEASGNVSLATVRAIAETGVDYISVGKLTHSAVAVDVGLDEG